MRKPRSTSGNSCFRCTPALSSPASSTRWMRRTTCGPRTSAPSARALSWTGISRREPALSSTWESGRFDKPQTRILRTETHRYIYFAAERDVQAVHMMGIQTHHDLTGNNLLQNISFRSFFFLQDASCNRGVEALRLPRGTYVPLHVRKKNYQKTFGA